MLLTSTIIWFDGFRAIQRTPLLQSVELEFKYAFASSENTPCLLGDLAWLKEYLDTLFQGTVLICESDPFLHLFEKLHSNGLCQLCIVPSLDPTSIATHQLNYVNLQLAARAVDNRFACCYRIEVTQDEKHIGVAELQPSTALLGMPKLRAGLDAARTQQEATNEVTNESQQSGSKEVAQGSSEGSGN